MFLTPRKPQAQVWVRPGRDPGSHLWAAPSARSRPSSPQVVPRGSWGGSQAPSPGRAASKDHPPPRPQQMPAAGESSAEGSGLNLLRTQG